MLNYEIDFLDKTSYTDSVRLLQLFYKEYKGELIHRIEAEQLLQRKDYQTIVLLVENEVRGLYSYKPTSDVYLIASFILDPRVRRKKIGYTLWKDMIKRFNNKPAIIGIIRENKVIENIIKKRGYYIGSGLDVENNTIDYYNLTYKDKKWKGQLE